MRPIGGVEHRITAMAVRLSVLTTAELQALLKRGSGSSKTARQAARRVLRVREVHGDRIEGA